MSATAVSPAAPREPADSGSARRGPLVPPMPGPVWLRWLGPVLLGVFAGILRFFRLGEPPLIYFDETYYAKDAYGLQTAGYERETVEDADEILSTGGTEIFADGGSVVVHPPFGKWMIAAGDALWALTPFGATMTPIGWRFAAALVGALSVVLLAALATRMTRSMLLGGTAGLLMAVDGLHFTMSRIAMVDVFLTFWILAGFACLVMDRDRVRARLVDLAAQGDTTARWLGVRWWRWAAGVCFGLALGTKWSAVFFIAAFGLLTVAWDYGARRAAGQTRADVEAPEETPHWRRAGAPIPLRWLVFDALPAFVATVVVAAATYVVTWAGWIFTTGGHNRDWSAQRPLGFWEWLPEPLLPAFDALRSLGYYHYATYSFHQDLTSEHDYMSMPWDWLIMRTPVVLHYDSDVSNCGASECARTVLSVGTPAVWWAALIAVVVMVAWWMTYRDWRAGAVLVAVAAGVLPWLAYPNRTMFVFYALPVLPFLVLAIVLALGLLTGPDADSPGFSQVRRVAAGVVFGVLLLLAVINFVYLYPVLSAEIVSHEDWAERMWFDTWIHGNNGP